MRKLNATVNRTSKTDQVVFLPAACREMRFGRANNSGTLRKKKQTRKHRGRKAANPIAAHRIEGEDCCKTLRHKSNRDCACSTKVSSPCEVHFTSKIKHRTVPKFESALFYHSKSFALLSLSRRCVDERRQTLITLRL